MTGAAVHTGFVRGSPYSVNVWKQATYRKIQRRREKKGGERHKTARKTGQTDNELRGKEKRRGGED